jgi:hypothetical protein
MEELANLLSAAPGRVSERDDGGAYPIHFAAKGGSIPVLELLVEYGADLGATTHLGWPCLVWAALSDAGNRAEVIRWLCSKGCEVSGRVLSLCAYTGTAISLAVLVDLYETDVGGGENKTSCDADKEKLGERALGSSVTSEGSGRGSTREKEIQVSPNTKVYSRLVRNYRTGMHEHEGGFGRTLLHLVVEGSTGLQRQSPQSYFECAQLLIKKNIPVNALEPKRGRNCLQVVVVVVVVVAVVVVCRQLE